MDRTGLRRLQFYGARSVLAATVLATAAVSASERQGSVLVLTSTNDPGSNAVVVFKLDTAGAPALSHLDTLVTGGKGGASTNAGIVQFRQGRGVV
ncbi:MAG TPA: hypothetical protein VF764_12275, partial [Steroidobacteraceae bacterium]